MGESGLVKEQMNTSKALDEWKSFLETTPPNTPLKIPDLRQRFDCLKIPQIQLYCEHDNGPRRFDPTHKVIPYPSEYAFITYQCRNCQITEKTFAVLVIQGNAADVEVMKLGEYPPFSAPISSRIKKLLSKADLELYRKGSRAEAQGLGIGAATYFRRIVEEQWKFLVTEIRKAADLLGAENLEVYDAALQETQFSKAVKILKDAIPGKLLILDGKNPLTLLYQPLSRQLHELTDEECLQQAAAVRVILATLLENIADVMRDQDELHNAAKRLNVVRPKPTD